MNWGTFRATFIAWVQDPARTPEELEEMLETLGLPAMRLFTPIDGFRDALTTHENTRPDTEQVPEPALDLARRQPMTTRQQPPRDPNPPDNEGNGRGWLLPLGILAAVLIVAGLVWFAMSRRGDGDTSQQVCARNNGRWDNGKCFSPDGREQLTLAQLVSKTSKGENVDPDKVKVVIDKASQQSPATTTPAPTSTATATASSGQTQQPPASTGGTSGTTTQPVTNGDPLEGIVKNSSSSPTTDRNGICNDLGWVSSQIGLQVVDLRSIGYVQQDGWADNCAFDSTGNTAGTKTVKCETQELLCTLRFKDGTVQVFKAEPGLTKNDVTSYTIRYLGRYPTRSPFRNPCFVLTFERNYGSTRNPSYETKAGNFDCPASTGFVPGNPLSIISPSDRSDANCTTPQTGIYVCRASRTLTITHPGGSVQIDVWPSYAEPDNCRGEIVENGVTKRISCSSPATLFADHFTIRENGSGPIQVSGSSAQPSTSGASASAPTASAGSSQPAAPQQASGEPFDLKASIQGSANCTYDAREAAWVCKSSGVKFTFPKGIAQIDVWSGYTNRPSGCQLKQKDPSTKALLCAEGTVVDVDNFTARTRPD